MLKIKVKYKNIKNIYIRINSNQEINISAPFGTTEYQLKKVIEKRKNWIQKQLNFYYFFNTLNREPKYNSGDKLKFLGKDYILQVIKAEKDYVKIKNSGVFLYTKNPNDANIKKRVIETWYKKEANICFNHIINKFSKVVKKEVKKVRIKKMQTRWGSCNYQKGYINLNLHLIKQDIKAIEYVIFHELTHLIYPRHDTKFYQYISLYMPDWKKRKQLLY